MPYHITTTPKMTLKSWKSPSLTSYLVKKSTEWHLRITLTFRPSLSQTGQKAGNSRMTQQLLNQYGPRSWKNPGLCPLLTTMNSCQLCGALWTGEVTMDLKRSSWIDEDLIRYRFLKLSPTCALKIQKTWATSIGTLCSITLETPQFSIFIPFSIVSSLGWTTFIV